MVEDYLDPERTQKQIQKVRKVKNRKKSDGRPPKTISNMTHAMTIPNIMIHMSHRKTLMFKFQINFKSLNFLFELKIV